MKKRFFLKRLVTSVLAAAVTVTTICTAPITVSAEDTFDDLDQYEIVEAMSPAWNLGNQLEATSNGTPNETVWGNPTITMETLQMVKDAGFNAVRIPVSYLNYIGDADSNYEIKGDWLDRVQEVVDYAYDIGLYVIINMHGDGYYSVPGSWLLCAESAEEQVEIKKKYAAVWEQIANRFKDYDEHLIFESMNEEHDGNYNGPSDEYYANINDYNQIFVDTVRQTGSNNAKRWLLVPGWNTDITYTAGDYGFEIPTDTYRDSSIPEDEQRIMISVHYYNPWDFCGEESTDVTTWGTDAEIQTIEDYFVKCYKKFVLEGYPVVIGEYGSIDKSNTESRALFASEVCKAARSMSMVPVYWDNGWNGTYGFALFNRTTKKVTQPEIIAAIMEAYEGEAEPAPDIEDAITKDEALAVIYYSKADGAVTLDSGTVDSEIEGATSIRITFDCASDVTFSQYTSLNVIETLNDVTTKTTVTGESELEGATALTITVDLSSELVSGDTYSISAYTQSWKDADDYVFLIRSVEYLDANGNVLKTVVKSDRLPGDVNNDGKVTTADVGLANSHAKGVTTLTGDDFDAADVNGDGSVTTADVGLINSHAKGVKLLW
ncbi:MAG: cellulase family glycosylhydrolase [Ruminococcus sp.]|nr:cellulase family glycosylhydrolase [Ruminococcus sp.]